MKQILFAILFFVNIAWCQAGVSPRTIRTPEYKALQEKLYRGWNTWYNNSMTSHVLLPEGLAINLCIATDDNRKYLKDVLKASSIQRRPEFVTPGLRSENGDYTSLTLYFEDIGVTVETATDGNDFIALVTPKKSSRNFLVVEAGVVYGNDGTIGKRNGRLCAKFGNREYSIHTTDTPVDNGYLTSTAPRINLSLMNKQGIYTGHKRSLKEVERIISNSREKQNARISAFGNLSDSFLAMQTILAWNTIYDASNRRVITPVSRNWNQNWGGYVLFGWDTYFAAYMFSLFNKELAYANAIEITKAITPDGFVPNFQSVSSYKKNGNTSSWDRSQPPVGSKVIWEIYKHYKDKWLLEEVYDELLTWNRWWTRYRDNKGYLAWGSSFVKDGEHITEGLQGAMYESGLDNSPMYDNVPMNPDSHLMELADVGLMSMYIMDCNALSEIAQTLGRERDVEELKARAKTYYDSLETLWDEETGIYRNKRLDTNQLCAPLSPTNFYPMLAGCPPEHTVRMMQEHYFNPEEFHGDYVLPTIARNAPGFNDNDYWRGRIWGPTNFLVYLGMRNYDIPNARNDLIDKSRNLIMKNWKKNGGIFENYNSITGEGDDVHNADGFYHWGALLTFMDFLEKGYLAK